MVFQPLFLYLLIVEYFQRKIEKMVDAGTKSALAKIPLLKTKAGPRDAELWVNRLKEEYQSLIKACVMYLLP